MSGNGYYGICSLILSTKSSGRSPKLAMIRATLLIIVTTVLDIAGQDLEMPHANTTLALVYLLYLRFHPASATSNFNTCRLSLSRRTQSRVMGLQHRDLPMSPCQASLPLQSKPKGNPQIPRLVPRRHLIIRLMEATISRSSGDLQLLNRNQVLLRRPGLTTTFRDGVVLDTRRLHRMILDRRRLPRLVVD